MAVEKQHLSNGNANLTVALHYAAFMNMHNRFYNPKVNVSTTFLHFTVWPGTAVFEPHWSAHEPSPKLVIYSSKRETKVML